MVMDAPAVQATSWSSSASTATQPKTQGVSSDGSCLSLRRKGLKSKRMPGNTRKTIMKPSYSLSRLELRTRLLLTK